MCAASLLQNILTKSCGFIHQKRLSALTELCNALIRCESLTMTEMGNALSEMSGVSERHCIKRVSNFLSNFHVQEENSLIQSALAVEILLRFKEIRILIDWTPAINRSHYILRANLVCKNSSIVIYQEVYLEKKSNNTSIQNRFLRRLSEIIPATIKKVIVITDAGFQGKWFQQVEKLGWYFCGRVRGTTKIWLKSKWEPAKGYAKKATAHIKSLGQGLLARCNKHKMHMYTYKQPLKALRKNSQRKNPNARTELKRSIRSYTEGWFIVTNLHKINTNIKKVIIDHYKDRMKIEASNRTTKSTKYGFGLSNSMTKSTERIKILILIEQIVSSVCWLVGAYQEHTRTDREYSNGGTKEGRRLSLVKLGVRVLKRRISLSWRTLMKMLRKLAILEASLC